MVRCVAVEFFGDALPVSTNALTLSSGTRITHIGAVMQCAETEKRVNSDGEERYNASPFCVNVHEPMPLKTQSYIKLQQNLI